MAIFAKAARQGLSTGREVLGAAWLMGEQEGRNKILHGKVSGVPLGWRPAVRSPGARVEGGEELTVCGHVIPCSEGFARHNLSVNSSPPMSAKWVQDEKFFIAIRNLCCSCSN